jgi:fatty-acyl-CoA synthase
LEGNDPLGNEQKFTGPFETGLDKNGANHQPLSPLSFLPRAAAVFPARTAVVHGDTSVTWAEAFTRCRRLASALARRGIGAGDCVAVMAPNIPPLWEAHFGVPVLGAVLNALNVRLDAATIAFILEHGEAKVLITDREFSPTIRAALAQLKRDILVIDIDDPQAPAGGERLGEIDYEAFLAGGDPEFPWSLPDDEWRGISLNYTSGTTGNPKGVVYHHRTRPISGPCRCSTAMAGAFPGPSPRWPAPMSACAGSRPAPFSPRSPRPRSPISAARPSSCRCCSTPRRRNAGISTTRSSS